MNTKFRTRSWAVVLTFALISLVCVFSSSAQVKPGPAPTPAWDTAINPHDFTDTYYLSKGVNPKFIIDRRTGKDGLSVFRKSSNPNHTDVRVIVTVPALDQTGEQFFWYPLGTLTNAGFTDDKVGFLARNTASLFPMYIFPDPKLVNFNSIANTRHAPLFDNSWAIFGPNGLNPLGLREVFFVTYTDMVNTPEGQKMMQYLGEKNGMATDATPIIKSVADMDLLKEYGCIRIEAPMVTGLYYKGAYAIAPPVASKPGVIAKDAFLWMSSRDGKPLEAEMKFVNQFNCLQSPVVCSDN